MLCFLPDLWILLVEMRLAHRDRPPHWQTPLHPSQEKSGESPESWGSRGISLEGKRRDQERGVAQEPLDWEKIKCAEIPEPPSEFKVIKVVTKMSAGSCS